MGLFGGRPTRKFANQAELAQQHLNEVAEARQKLLNEYKQNAPAYEQQQINESRQNFAGQLKGNVNNLNSNANSRGLLFSGQRAAKEGLLRGGARLDQASEKDAISKRMKDYIESQQTDIEGQRLGLQTQRQQGLTQGINESAGMDAKNAAMNGQLMQAGGYAAGNYFGGGNQQPQASPRGGSPYAGSFRPSQNIYGSVA